MAKHPWPDQRWPKGQDPLARYQEWADNRYNPGHWLGANTPPDTRGLWSTRDRHWLGWAYTAGGTIGLIMAARIAQDIASFVIVAGMLLEVLVPGVLMLLGRDSNEQHVRRRRRSRRT